MCLNLHYHLMMGQDVFEDVLIVLAPNETATTSEEITGGSRKMNVYRACGERCLVLKQITIHHPVYETDLASFKVQATLAMKNKIHFLVGTRTIRLLGEVLQTDDCQAALLISSQWFSEMLRAYKPRHVIHWSNLQEQAAYCIRNVSLQQSCGSQPSIASSARGPLSRVNNLNNDNSSHCFLLSS